MKKIWQSVSSFALLSAIYLQFGGVDGEPCACAQSVVVSNDTTDTAASRIVAEVIKDVLTKQEEAWNRGSIDDFMEHYWKSDDLTFSSGGKTTRGWTATKQNYKRRYPTREQMGQVAFNQLELFSLGQSAALVLGQWRLQRQAGQIGGNFSLVFRKIDGRWLIVHDHTSRLEPSSPGD